MIPEKGGKRMKTLKKYINNKFNIQFEDENLLKEAFTHSSYVNEYLENEESDNERLEFLGDAVLEILISDYLYHEYPDHPEGVLSRARALLVQEKTLSRISKACGFNQFIRLGKGEEKNSGRKRESLLADLFEAFLGAVYLDQGLPAVDRFLSKVIYPTIDEDIFSHGMDYKTTLQEFLQKSGQITISYEIIDTFGPDHDRQFTAQVLAEDDVLGVGTGKSKKMAEQAAAKEALEQLS